MTVEELIAFVERRFDVPSGSLVGRDRHKTVALARNVAMWLLRKQSEPVRSYPELGRIFGNRDHTTVMAACLRIELRRLREPWFATFVDAIDADVGLVTGACRARVEPELPRVRVVTPAAAAVADIRIRRTEQVRAAS